MASLRPWVLIWLALILSGGQTALAASAETPAYTAALNRFQDTVWDSAEAQLAQFATTYPKSARVPEVVLLQAQAQYKQGKFSQAIDLLAARQAAAGKLADQYAYWIGEAYYQSTNYEAAADAFARLIRDFPASTNRLDRKSVV